MNVTGLGTPANPWTVEFSDPVSTNIPPMTVDLLNAVVATVIPGTYTTTEVQTVYRDSSVTGGTFALTLTDAPAPIAWNAPTQEQVPSRTHSKHGWFQCRCDRHRNRGRSVANHIYNAFGKERSRMQFASGSISTHRQPRSPRSTRAPGMTRSTLGTIPLSSEMTPAR